MQIKKFLIPIGLLAIIAVFSAVAILLWNWLMPSMFGLDAVNFWQTWVLLSFTICCSAILAVKSIEELDSVYGSNKREG